LQYEIFRLLDNNRNRLFFVGDLKQSIYKFRGADSTVFETVADNSRYDVIHLSRNFRSSDGVIDGVNRLFSAVMPNYDENAELKSGRNISRGEYVTEVVVLDENSYPEAENGKEAEAVYTAIRINKMIADEFPVSERDGSVRKCGYGDFAVLSSTGEANFKVYEKVFARYGIPCVSAGGGGYLKAEEVGAALDLLTVIDNPYNDLALLNIMMSPIFGFTAEEVAAMRINHSEMPLFSSVIAWNSCKKAAKVTVFLDTLARYRRLADVVCVSELISVINGDGVFLPLLMTDKSAKPANLRLLTFYAEQFTRSGNSNPGLSAFLTYIVQLKKSDIDVRQANVNSLAGGCVKLMTIHASKGLEFPVCFAARTNSDYFRKGGGVKTVSHVAFHNTAGIVADYYDETRLCRFKTMLTDYVRRLEREETSAEEMRKLYVAATRAECKLIFTAFAKDGKITPNSYLSLINAADLTSTTNFHASDTSDAHDDVAAADVAVNADDTGFAANCLSYKREPLCSIPRKLSATQVGVVRYEPVNSSGDYDEPTLFPRNPSFHGTKRLSGKQRGDAYHKAMELIDFAAGDYHAQMQCLQPRFTAAEYRVVNPDDISEFFASPLGLRAVAAANVNRLVKEYALYTQVRVGELGYALEPELSAEKCFVQGIADMFFYENDEIVLVDYKTNRNTTADKLRLSYSGQLFVYKRAIEEMTACKVKECWLYSFERGQIRL
jgi:ATP-dependent helicase/nuclease subunit A